MIFAEISRTGNPRSKIVPRFISAADYTTQWCASWVISSSVAATANLFQGANQLLAGDSFSPGHQATCTC